MRYRLPVLVVVVMAAFVMLSPLHAGSIHDAVKACDTNRVNFLIKINSAAARETLEDGITPLHIAASKNDRRIAEILLEGGADLNARTSNGSTPLHWAAMANAREAVELFVARGADVKAKTIDGLSVMEVARAKNAFDVVNLLDAGQKQDGAATAGKDASYPKAMALLEKGDGAAAFDLFMQLFRRNPGNVEINLALGQAAFVAGKYSHATLAFERLIRMDPANDRARLELARSYYAAKQYGLSRDEFEKVLARNPPDNVKKNIRDFLELIRKTEKRSGFGAKAEMGMFYDDNVNVGPNSSVIQTSLQDLTITLDDSSLPIKSFGQYLAAGAWGHYDPGRKGKWVMTANGTVYKSWLKKDARNRETLYAGINAGVQRGEQKYLVRIPAKAEHLALGGSGLMNIVGVAPSYMRSLGESRAWYMTVQATLESRKYVSLADRDGPYYALGCEFGRYFKNPAAMVSGGVNAFFENTETGAYRNKGGEMTLNGEIGTVWKMVAYGRVRYKIAQYAEPEPLSPADRRDNQLQATLGLRRPISESWALDVNIQRTSNNSTFDLHEYRRNVMTIGASYVY